MLRFLFYIMFCLKYIWDTCAFQSMLRLDDLGEFLWQMHYFQLI